MLTSRSSLILAALALTTWSGVADAQVVSRAPRGFRGIFGTRQPPDPLRPHQDLLFNLNVVGGLDDNVGAGESVGPPVPGTSGSGATSQIDLSLDYNRGTAKRSFGLASWGQFSNYYGDTTLPSNRSGGVGLTGRTEVTQRTSVGGGARINYLSQLPISLPLEVGTVADSIPPSAGLTGVYDRGSWNTSLDGNVERRWTRRSSTQLDYAFVTTEFVEGSDGDLRSHRLQATHRRLFARASSIDAAYEFGETRVGISDNGDPGRPTTDQRIYGGVTVSRRLSSTRTLDFSVHGGALYVDATAGGTNADYQLWTPMAQASLRAGVFGQWAVETNYERTTQSIPGFARPETYITDTVMTSLGGVIGRRIDLVFSGAFATGDVGVGVEGSSSEYVTSSVSAQFRVNIIRNMAAVVGYSFYHYRFTDTLLPVGLPSEFDRNALRVGLTFSLPVIGSDTGR